MDRLGGSFGAHDDAFGPADGPEFDDIDSDLADFAPLAPPSPVGQDERRMQVRAYNHWAALLGDGHFPNIEHLEPEKLADFGPYGVLLDFRGRRGMDDPAIRFLGTELAAECGGDGHFKRLSDVPGRSLLSRITDHYLQILANQAPIGFEAEFTNQRGANVLYRGILLPWSSDGATIDFIFGVINWKELADAETAERLLSAIDTPFEAPIAPYEGKDMDRMLDLSGFAEDTGDDEGPQPLPLPAFGAAVRADEIEDDGAFSPFELTDEADEDDEDAREASEWGGGFSGFGDEDTVYTVDYGAQGLEDGEIDEDTDGVLDPLADDTVTSGLASLVARSGRIKASVVLPGRDGPDQPAMHAPTTSQTAASTSLPRTTLEQRLRAAIPQGFGSGDGAPAPAAEPTPSATTGWPEGPTPAHEPDALELTDDAVAEAGDHVEPLDDTADLEEGEGLYDCLAAARELAQTARSNEDRGRKALYQAVARAYDFSIEAAASPDDFSELLVENGLTAQDRAPMTPVVKLVFGADYDKTRLTEYATVLSYAHRTGVARGTLDKVLSGAEGGLKGIVQAERHARKEAQGKPVEAVAGVRPGIARKLRKLDPVTLDDLSEDGAEFALVMVRRLPSGELVVLGEVPEDRALVEKAARTLLA